MSRTRTLRKRYFTPEEANRTLPLVRSIVREVVETASDLRKAAQQAAGRYLAPAREAAPGREAEPSPEHDGLPLDRHERDEDHLAGRVEELQARLLQLQEELARLGVLLKDFDRGLVDFPARMGAREICLCWQHGEETVASWHETTTGFAGRRPIRAARKAPPPPPGPTSRDHPAEGGAGS